jgi:hypothetical protein
MIGAISLVTIAMSTHIPQPSRHRLALCRKYRASSTIVTKISSVTMTILAMTIAISCCFPSYCGMAHPYLLIDAVVSAKPVYIRDRQLEIVPKLQQEIATQIPDIDRSLATNLKLFAIPIQQQISVRYFHQGRNQWRIQITYGGYPIESTDETLYTSAEIFDFKQAVAVTSKIKIAGKIYDLNNSMRQIGPIWHERGVKC